MHEKPNVFNNGRKQYNCVEKLLNTYPITSLLDFGCGKGGLIEVIKYHHPAITCISGYDPGYLEFENLPTTTFECVISTDALEHIEPEFLLESLSTIDRLFTKYCFLRIACYPAKKKLPDGRNAHLIVESPQWWIDTIKSRISGNFIETEIRPFHGKPKKGPEIFGHELMLLISK
jgi:hypothetical protein